jgi:hypothetical protein
MLALVLEIYKNSPIQLKLIILALSAVPFERQVVITVSSPAQWNQ